MSQDKMPRKEMEFLKEKGWQRRKMHTNGATDWWAHPTHSPRPVVVEEERAVFNDWGDRIGTDVVEVNKPAWRWFTREDALAIEGASR